jgi:hypothetical protein
VSAMQAESTSPLSEQQIAEIKNVVASWPPLTAAQKDALAALFGGDQ